MIKLFRQLCLAALVWSFVPMSGAFGQQDGDSEQTLQPLKPGDTMPDIPLGKVLNNKMGKTRFSDLKGKLVILDFWNSYCGSCIEGFPKMQHLQRLFADQIQIILVNPLEDEDQLERRFKTNPKLRNRLPDLPSIVGAKEFEQLFPSSSGSGYHVYIDSKGKILAKTNYLSTYPEKIAAILAGKEVNFLTLGDIYVDQTPTTLSELNLKEKNSAIGYHSLITKFNEAYGPGGGSILNKRDSIAGTIRNTFINKSGLSLFYRAVEHQLSESKSQLLFGPYSSWMNFVQIKGADSSRLDDSFSKMTYMYPERPEHLDPFETPIKAWRTDTGYAKANYCYEQILPIGTPESRQDQYMLEDLNRYFGNRFGIEGAVENVRVKGYVLRRMAENKPKITNRPKNLKEKSYDLALKDLLSSAAVAFRDHYLWDETEGGANEPVAISWSNDIDKVGFEELRDKLVTVGFALQPVEREIPMLVIRETKNL